MNKIGFRISKCKEGFVVGQTENAGDWVNRVVDIRDILKLYDIEPEKFAIMMSFSRSGAYITVSRPISGRVGDNIAAWIYIPANIDVPAETVISIINIIKDQISATRADENLLREVFSQEYSTVPFAEYKPSSDRKIFAKRSVGEYSLADILGTNRYQSNYADYNAILIEDFDTMRVKSDPNITDLTRAQLMPSYILCPPAPEKVPMDVTVLLGDGTNTPFIHPVRANKGQSVAVVFRNKSTFGAKISDIRYQERVTKDFQQCDIPPLEWKVKITPDMFRFRTTDDSSINLSGKAVSITWREKEIKPQGVELTMDEAEKMRVRIKASGYETKEQTCDFRKASFVNITLSPSAKDISIKLANDDLATLTLRTKKFGNDESPLKGYEYDDRNTLVYSQVGVWIQRAIGFGAAALIVIILFILGLFTDFGLTWGGSEQQPQTTQQKAPQKKDNNKVTNDSTETKVKQEGNVDAPEEKEKKQDDINPTEDNKQQNKGNQGKKNQGKKNSANSTSTATSKETNPDANNKPKKEDRKEDGTKNLDSGNHTENANQQSSEDKGQQQNNENKPQIGGKDDPVNKSITNPNQI